MKLKRTITIASYAVITAVMAVMLVCPLIEIFIKAVVVDGRLSFALVAEVLGKSENLQTIFNSLSLGVAVVILSTLISFPLAYIFTKTPLAKYRFMDIILLIPFMTPPYISSMGWILFMQNNGLLVQMIPALKGLSESFFSFGGLTLVMSLNVFPFMFNILKNAILNVNGNLDDAGKVYGAGFFGRMGKITLPLLSGNFVIGALLVFVKTLSEYGTPYTLGNYFGFSVFTTKIHDFIKVSPISFGSAATLSCILVLICMAFWLLQSYITNKNKYALISAKGKGNENKKMHPALLGGCALYVVLVLAVAIGIPYFSVICNSLFKLRSSGLSVGNYTFAYYAELFTAKKAVKAMQTSAFLAFTAASISAVLGTGVGVLLYYGKEKYKKVIEFLALLPEMLPNIVLVIGFMLFWNALYKVIPLYNTLGLMVLAYVVFFLPYTVSYVTSSFTQMNDRLIDAGRICGGSKGYVFFKVVLPLVLKGAVTGWMMTFIISFRELVAASLMSPLSTLTVSTYIMSQFEQGNYQLGMAMAVVSVLFTTAVLFVVNALTDGRKKNAA